MDLPWKRHFGVKCSCGQACLVELQTKELVEAAERDATIALRLLPRDDQVAMVDFWLRHHKLGHEPEPTLAEIAPLPKS